jgi:hypothetical protein
VIGARLTPSYCAGLSEVMMIRLTPSVASRCVSRGIGIAPTASCPPVIATAEL